VNYDLAKLFDLGQQDLRLGNCGSAAEIVVQVVNLMRIGLIQGTIRYAYYVGELEGVEKEKAEGATFAAAVLPAVHNCSKADAAIIYDNMGFGADTTDFAAVKKAFEVSGTRAFASSSSTDKRNRAHLYARAQGARQGGMGAAPRSRCPTDPFAPPLSDLLSSPHPPQNNYECLGITCADVGGLWFASSDDYYEGAAPCEDASNSIDLPVGGIVGIVIAVVVAIILLILLCIVVRRERTGKPLFLNMEKMRT
jgi:hypothetical protein